MAGVRVNLKPLASPGTVAFKRLSSPETLAKFQESAATALKEKGNFLLVTEKSEDGGKEILLNLDDVASVYSE